MKLRHVLRLLALASCCAWQGAACAQMLLVPDAEPQRVFCGDQRRVSLVFSNAADQTVVTDLRARIMQASSVTAVTIGEAAWKTLSVFAGQTVFESATLDFSPVRAETRFIVQWLEGASNVIGQTLVLVYPTNLLTQLKALAGDEPLGVFDPADALKPLLRLQAVPVQDLLEDGTDKFRGKLAVFGPFESKAQMRASLKDDMRALAKRGVAVVWLLPRPERRDPLKPSFYIVHEGAGEGTVVVAAHNLVAHLAERPEAQLNLLRLAQEALDPTPLVLPESESSN